MSFEPKFVITPPTAKALMEIESCRSTLDGTISVSPHLIATLRKSARLLSTHFSTQIEGNRLSAEEVEAVIIQKKGFPGRERDEREVLNHYRAAEKMEEFARSSPKLSEREIQTLHGLVMEGKPKPTPYRDGQNVIRDGATGGIVYMPPEAPDVPKFMADLVTWVNAQIDLDELPIPVIAGLAHYQFATIHPYYDGNGRTARLLANLILHRGGYGLSGIYSLEEYYARNLGGYYEALTVGDSHNYYMGRAECDLSGFVEFFCAGMANSFSQIATNIANLDTSLPKMPEQAMRALSPIQRQAMGLFQENMVITATQLAEYLGLNSRKGRELCAKWANDGFLEIHDPSRKARSYSLAKKFEEFLSLPETE